MKSAYRQFTASILRTAVIEISSFLSSFTEKRKRVSVFSRHGVRAVRRFYGCYSNEFHNVTFCPPSAPSSGSSTDTIRSFISPQNGSKKNRIETGLS